MLSSNRGARVALTLLAVAIIAASGIAIGYGFGTSVQISSHQTTTSSSTTSSSETSASSASNSSQPYVLTLVITTENIYNSSIGDQPAYYVLGPDGLQSSAKIVIPANRLIELVIINYDDGAANLSSATYESVSGTVNNKMLVVNNTKVNSTMTASGIQIRGAESVGSLPADDIAHTFTVPSLGLNIPAETSAMMVAFFTVSQPGTYNWFCMTACGSGADGLGGAMATPGWMTGTLVVQ